MSGYIMVEVLIAMVVMAVGMLAIGRYQTGLLNENAFSRRRAEAVTIAERELEKLQKLSLADLILLESDTGTAVNGETAVFTPKWTVVQTRKNTEVTMSVEWTDKNGAVVSVKSTTVLASYDPIAATPVTLAKSTATSSSTTTTTTTTKKATTTTTTKKATTTTTTKKATTTTKSSTTTTTATTCASGGGMMGGGGGMMGGGCGGGMGGM
jgi:Tfp pilus assembly protein PilV